MKHPIGKAPDMPARLSEEMILLVDMAVNKVIIDAMSNQTWEEQQALLAKQIKENAMNDQSPFTAWKKANACLFNLSEYIQTIQPIGSKTEDTAARVEANVRANVNAAKQALQAIHNQTGPVVSPSSMKAVQSRLLTIDKCLSIILEEAALLVPTKEISLPDEMTVDDTPGLKSLNFVDKPEVETLPKTCRTADDYKNLETTRSETPTVNNSIIIEDGCGNIAEWQHSDPGFETYICRMDLMQDGVLPDSVLDDKCDAGCDQVDDQCQPETYNPTHLVDDCVCQKGDGCDMCGGGMDEPKALTEARMDLNEVVKQFMTNKSMPVRGPNARDKNLENQAKYPDTPDPSEACTGRRSKVTAWLSQ